MIRKFAIAVAAVAALGTASLTLTAAPAAAKGFHHHHHHGHHGHWGRGFYFYGPDYVSYEADCVVEKVVETRRGPRVRLINICD